MWIQEVTHADGVVEKCKTEAGATSFLRNCRVGCAALVTPASILSQTNRGPDQVPLRAESGTGMGPVLVLD